MNIPDSLEFRRLLDAVAHYAGTPIAEDLLRRLTPHTDEEFLAGELVWLERLWYLLEEGSPPFFEIGDPRKVLERLQSIDASLDTDEFLQLQHSLHGLRVVRKWFTDRGNRSTELKAIVDRIQARPDLEEAIDDIIDPNGRVRDDASVELRKIRRELAKFESLIRDSLESSLKDWASKGYLQDELVTIRDGHYVIPVLVNFKNRVRGVAQDTSQSGNTVYVEPIAVIELGNRMRATLHEEEEEIRRILKVLANQIQPEIVQIEESVAAAIQLDHLSARVFFGKAVNGCLPTLSPTRELRLRGARHPLLQLRIGRDHVVPLDLDLTEQDGRVLLISGPNAGGKTVTLKTVGLTLAMALSGLPVCCDVAEIPFLTELFAIIGDDQSIETDLSTFSAHLTGLVRTLQSRQSNKLILVDEICSGTDPTEGSALSRALLERWRDDGCFVVCTTHQSSLKLFVQEEPGMINGSMTFDEHGLHPTFRFRLGVPGSSYALEIAAKVNIPVNVLDRAKSLLGDRTVQIERLLEEISTIREETQRLQRETLKEKSEIDRQAEAAKTDRETAKAELLHAKREASTLAEGILRDANKRIEAEVRQLRETQATPEAIRQAHATIDAIRDELRSKTNSSPKKRSISTISPTPNNASATPTPIHVQPVEPARELRVGDLVKLRDSGNEAMVTAIGDDYVQVEAGNVKIRLSFDSILPGKGVARPAATTSARSTSTGVGNRVDLRGMLREEALETLETYIADAAAEGWSRVEIIHGKGMGVLKEATAEFLKKCSFVAEWRVGLYGEGSGGATIVTLKKQ